MTRQQWYWYCYPWNAQNRTMKIRDMLRFVKIRNVNLLIDSTDIWMWDCVEWIAGCYYKWNTRLSFRGGLVCQKQVWRSGTSKYILQMPLDVVSYPCMWFGILAHKSWNKSQILLWTSARQCCSMSGVSVNYSIASVSITVLLHKPLNHVRTDIFTMTLQI